MMIAPAGSALRAWPALLVAYLLLAPSASAQEGSGGFGLYIGPYKGGDELTAGVAAHLADGGRDDLHQLVADLNELIELDGPVSIEFATWSDIDRRAMADLAQRPPGALFDRGGTKDIYVSFEFLAEVFRLLDKDTDAWSSSVINVVLHEVGHALIEINAIDAPSTGDAAEVAADEIAFYVLSELYAAEEDLRNVAEHFWRLADKELDADELAALHEQSDHFPDLERANRFECWIEGRFETGSDDCVDEYEALVADWEEKLADSWRQ